MCLVCVVVVLVPGWFYVWWCLYLGGLSGCDCGYCIRMHAVRSIYVYVYGGCMVYAYQAQEREWKGVRRQSSIEWCTVQSNIRVFR